MWSPKTVFVCKFSCLLNVPATNLAWSASVFGLSLPSVYRGQFTRGISRFQTSSSVLGGCYIDAYKCENVSQWTLKICASYIHKSHFNLRKNIIFFSSGNKSYSNWLQQKKKKKELLKGICEDFRKDKRNGYKLKEWFTCSWDLVSR